MEKKFLHFFLLPTVAESSTRVMYLLALLCSEIGGNYSFPSAVNATFLGGIFSSSPWEEKLFPE
jgi:hypothetical protein